MHWLRVWTLVSFGLAVAACSSESPDRNCDDGTCDEAAAPACPPMVLGGNNMTPTILAPAGLDAEALRKNLNDPVAQLLLRPADGGCPASFPEVMAKLRKTDTVNCTGERDGLTTFFTSERMQATGQADKFRTVITRTCNGRKPFELLISVFSEGADQLSATSMVLSGWDRENGVHNFYTQQAGQWLFFGNSLDFVTRKDTQPATICNGCHQSGSPVMRELHAPWLHWEDRMGPELFPPDGRFPNSAPLVAATADVGRRGNAQDLERDVIVPSITSWNTSRVQRVPAEGTIADLLRPILCSQELNIATAARAASPPSGAEHPNDMSEMPASAFVHPFLRDHAGLGALPMPSPIYRAAIIAAGQQVGDLGGLSGKFGPAIDTIFDFSYPENAFADADYVQRLIDAGVIDAELAIDGLMVDFTRPVDGNDPGEVGTRCSLIKLAPVDPEGGRIPRTADAIRDAFIASLEAARAAGTLPAPGDELLANLQRPGDADADSATGAAARLRRFLDTCNARDGEGLMNDVLRVIDDRRELARLRAVFAFAPESFPRTTLGGKGTGLRLDEATCTLPAAPTTP